MYGDLWKISFSNQSKERIVVVNVNTAFDVIVDSPGIPNSLVSARTIHGQWITKMKELGIKEDELNEAIQNNLKERNIIPSKRLSKCRGNNTIYEKGTIAEYKYGKTIFFLVALSEFDDNNNAQNTFGEFLRIIDILIEFIAANSQGADVYIPLMGSGCSRTGISDQKSLEIISDLLKIKCDRLFGNIKVVVYEGSRDKVFLDRN